MSDIKKLWLASHLDILERKARQGASNAVIATEFTFLPRHSNGPQPYIPTEQDIAQKRQEMKLPPENAALAVSSSVLPSAKPFEATVLGARVDTQAVEKTRKPDVIKVVTSKAIAPVDYDEKVATFNARVSLLSEPVKIEKPSKPEKPPEPVKAAEDFNAEAAEETPKDIAVKLPPELSLQFEPKIPASYKAGTKYYHPIHGIIQYEGITKTETSVGTFEFMKFLAGKENIQIKPSKIADHNIRLFADAAFMDSILQAIEDRSIRGKRPVGRGLMQIKACTDIVASGDPVKLAGLIYWAYKVPETKRINNVHGDKAITRLAEEYAFVKGIDFDQAKKMFVEKSSRPTGMDLLKNTESPQYARRNVDDPSPS